MDKILEIGLYNPNFLLHEDKELMERFKKKYKLHNITLPLYRYRMHSTNITHNKENDVFFNNKLIKLVPTKPAPPVIIILFFFIF